MYGGQAQSGGAGKRDGQQTDPEKNPEVFPEKKAAAENREKQIDAEKMFGESQSYINLAKHIPGEIEVGTEITPFTTNINLLDRIVTEVGNMSTSSGAFDSALNEFGEDFLGISKIDDMAADKKDIVLQKLAVISACHDDRIIHLKPEDRKALAQLLLPLVSTTEVQLTQMNESKEVLDENSALEEYPGYPYIERMHQNGDITEEQFQNFINAYKEVGSIENIDRSTICPAIVGVLEMIRLDDSSIKENNKNNFLKVFPDYTDEIENTPALTIIGEHFLSIPVNKDGHKDKEVDFQTAVDVAANTILWKVKNIDRSTERFKKAMIDTKSEKQNEQIHGISVLLELKGIYEGAPAKKAEKSQTAIEKLLRKSHKEGQAGHQHKLAKIASIRQAERNDTEEEGENTNDDNYSLTGNAPLATGNTTTEVVPSKNDNNIKKAA